MKKYIVIYGVPCRDVKAITPIDKYGLVRVSYKIKSGRKVHKCWIDAKLLK